MLAEKTKQDVQELVTILTKLDNTGRTIMLSNATVLLARQEVTENNDRIGQKLEKASF